MAPGLTRRGIIGAGAAAAGLALTSSSRAALSGLEEPLSIHVVAEPLRGFAIADPGRVRFGGLAFRGGVALTSPHPDFGGFSALWRSPDGKDLVAVSDHGRWLTAKVVEDGGRIAGLREAVIAPMLAAGGRPLSRTRSYDTESLAIAGGVAFVGIERSQEVMRFDWSREGVRARGKAIPVPPEVKRLRANRGLEALGIAPAASPLSGALVAIAEEPRAGVPDGFILTGPRRGSFQVARSDGYAVTDLAFLPNGDLLLLERRYVWPLSISMRVRGIDGRKLAPGALIDGTVLMEAGSGAEIDNMEGLAVHRSGGQTILTLISDDNFSMFQRTLLIEFALLGD